VNVVVINSFGPMGSTVCASIIEKFGYLNIPVRKLKLHEYLLGEKNLEDDIMFKRLKVILKSHSHYRNQGGISVLDRDNSPPVRLVDISRVTNELNNFSAKNYETVKQLYSAIKSIYAKSVIYKDIPVKKCNNHIELTTDIRKFNPDLLYQSYIKNFNSVKMIHLHRNFTNWLNSYASQWFATPFIKSDLKLIRLSKHYKQYIEYCGVINNIPGLHLNFDELFIPNTQKTIKKIGEYLSLNPPSFDWKKEKYDLYGRMSDYSKTFTVFDDNINHLSWVTKSLIKFIISLKLLNIFTDMVVSVFFVFDYLTHSKRVKMQSW